MKLSKSVFFLVSFFALLYFSQMLSSCQSVPNMEYDVKLDSVHMGVVLGMTRQEFFDHCWGLNKSGQNIIQGHHNTSVMHTDSVNFNYPVDINFYPQFNAEGIAYILPVRFEYRPWAPWNKEAYSDQLLPEVMRYIEDAYDVKLEPKTLDTGTEIWYSHTAPRLITVYAEDDHYVQVNFKNEVYK